jgi:hypothetical protein
MKPRVPLVLTDLSKVRCKEHWHIGGLPCPWPSCPNGILEDEIISYAPPLHEDSGQSLTRKEWRSLTNEIRFRWDVEGEPCWLGLNKLIQEELARTIGPPPEVGPIIYHYTNVQALFGIVESNCIWLTDYGYLNDSREINYGLSLTHELVQKKKATTSAEGAAVLEAWEKTLSESTSHRICVACFSHNGDNLSQWRSYGKEGRGICIGFDIRSPHFYLMKETSRGPVLYDRSKQELTIEIVLHMYFSALKWDKEKDLGQGERGDYYETLLTSEILRQISLFKDVSFADEREIRIAYIEDPEVFERVRTPKARVLFRSTDKLIIPYTTSSDLITGPRGQKPRQDPGTIPIAEIIVGPQGESDLIVKSIESYLTEKTFSSVTVRKSKIPFRSFH